MVLQPSPTREDLRLAIQAFCFKVSTKEQRIIHTDELTLTNWLFDFRALLLQSQWLDYYAELFWEHYGDQFPFQVCGMETAAISLVAAIVMKGKQRGLSVNGLYVRKSRKRTGLLKAIEGTPTNDPAILVDDLINYGNAMLKQIRVLHDAGVPVLGTFTLLAFREPDAYQQFTEQGITVKYIFTLKDFGLSVLQTDTAKELPTRFTSVWRFKAPHPSYNLVVQKSTPALAYDNVYYGTDAGNFFALAQATGEVVWSFKIGAGLDGRGILSSPVVHDKKVFFGGYDGNVYALDALTGSKVWVNEDADWIGSSPALAVDKKLLFVGIEVGLFGKKGGIMALDMMTGEKVWQQTHMHFTHSSPLYVPEENMVIIGSNSWQVFAYEATTGKLLWTQTVLGAPRASFVYDAVRRQLYGGTTQDGRFYALRASDGEPVFSKQCAGMFSTPVLAGDTVYFSCLDKHVYAYDVVTWKQTWAYKTKGRIFASPLLAQGAIWIGSNDGCLYELDEKTGKVKNYFQFSERVVNKIAVSEDGQKFFVGTQANEMYCLKRIEK